MISAHSKRYIVEAISYLFILLFVYASVSKLLDFQNFQVQIAQSPLLSAFAVFASYAVILYELLISILLAIPVTRKIALFLALSLMVMFTTYIIIILNFSPFVPCSCGGILEKLGWTEHLIFNVAFIIFAIVGILLINHSRKTFLLVAICLILSAALIVIMYRSSETMMQKENPFIRRFLRNAVTKTHEIQLPSDGFYIAGQDKDSIYVTNHATPSKIYSIDKFLKNLTPHEIYLDREDYRFRSLELRIVPPYFFMYDGLIPIVYRGKVSEWKGKSIYNGKDYFTNAVVADSNQVIIRGQKKLSGESIIAALNFKNNPPVKYFPEVLQTQIDGIFDTDGTMQYSREVQRFVYTYYYRNQYIVSDKNCNVIFRGNTIDTTKHANLKVVTIKSSGDRKMAAPPVTANVHTAIYGNLLFVHSGLKGRMEGNIMFNIASPIDIYDIVENKYVGSFYIYHVGKDKMSDFLATKDAVYVISGKTLQKYTFRSLIINKIKY